jgi:hypothetical protein
VQTVRVDNACEFGKWFYSLEAAQPGSQLGKSVPSLHAEFHRVAAEVLGLALSGHRAEASHAMGQGGQGGQFAHLSAELTAAIREWKLELAQQLGSVA